MMVALDLDPNVVKPGWTPLIILIVLAVVMVVLFLSMRRQFKKISIPEQEEPPAAEAADTGATAQGAVDPPRSPA